MRRDEPITPFDLEADDLTQEFWGTSTGWVSGEHDLVRRNSAAGRTGINDTGAIRAIREGFAAFRPQLVTDSGRVERVRRHGVPPERVERITPAGHREATLGELADGRTRRGGWIVDEGNPVEGSGHRDQHLDHRRDPEVDVPLTPSGPIAARLGGLDPLLVRAGLALFVLVALIPVVLSLRPDHAGAIDDRAPIAAPQLAGADSAPSSAMTPSSQTAPSSPMEPSTSLSGQTATAVAAATDTVAPAQVESVRPSADTQVASPSVAASGIDASATVGATAGRVVPTCPQTYTAGFGDSWYRIADEAGITPTALLAENGAHLDTVIFPGDAICLPAGAAVPTTPTTTTPATTPATTVPPSSTVPASGDLSREEVQALIRQTWPADEVETALAIAERESNFIATADNGWCCVGVFQIYWEVHQGWLDDFGVYQRSDLYDARKNIAAAFHLWQGSGWSPWRL